MHERLLKIPIFFCLFLYHSGIQNEPRTHTSHLFFILIFIIFGCGGVYVAVCGLPLVVVSKGYSLVMVCRLLILVAPLVTEHGLQSMLASVVVACRLKIFSTLAKLPCGMWNLSGVGIEPMSPALAGRFLATCPPGKSHTNT